MEVVAVIGIWVVVVVVIKAGRGLTMVNPGPLYMGRRGRDTFNPLQKYEVRGFRYIDLTDGHGMWMDRNTLPHVPVFSADIFARYGCLDIYWILNNWERWRAVRRVSSLFLKSL